MKIARFILLLFCLLAGQVPASMPLTKKEECLFYYEFQGEMPADGYPDLTGHLKPIRPNGKVALTQAGNLLFDGESTYLSIPGSETLPLEGNTLMALVTFHDSNIKKEEPDSYDSLFFRKYELTYGRNLNMFFADYHGIVSGPTWKGTTGENLLCTISFEKVEDQKSQYAMFLEDKQQNWPKAQPFREANPKNMPMPLEFGRNSWDRKWFLHGEVRMIAMYQGKTTPLQLRLMKEHWNFKEVTSLQGHAGDFTADFFFAPKNWDAAARGDVTLGQIRLGEQSYSLVKKGGETILTFGEDAVHMPVHSLVALPWDSLQQASVRGRHLVLQRLNGNLQFFLDGFPAAGTIQTGGLPFQELLLNRETSDFSPVHFFQTSRNPQEIRAMFRLRCLHP